MRFRNWRTLAAGATAALMATLLAPAAAQSTPRESKPVYSYENAIRESVWVDTRLDGDKDGKTDRVAVDIVRPRELARQGRKIPVIMDASPYYSCCGRGNESQKKTYDANGNVVQMPLYYDNYFVPRGYAFVGVDFTGTNRSDGCVDVGGRSDVQSAKAVVDWLNGRAKGYTSRTGSTKAKANWTNGKTGMIGVPAGHRLALIVAGTDKDLIDPPSTTPTLKLDLSRTWARVPFVGGAKAFSGATSGSAHVSPEARLDGVDEPRAPQWVPGGSR